MQIGYMYIRPVQVLYMRTRGPYRRSATAAWSSMLAWVDARGARERLSRGYGVMNDDPLATPEAERRYDACVEAVEGLDVDPDAGVGRLTVPGGAFVVHRHVGRHRTIGAGFSYIRRKWVPGNGLEVDRRRPYLEIYLNDPASTPPQQLMTDLCVPVIPVDRQMTAGPFAAE